jgi:FkbM family methyltransferase
VAFVESSNEHRISEPEVQVSKTPFLSANTAQEPEPLCTPEQEERQGEVICKYYASRHNLKIIFPFLRFHMPEATLLVDVGANKGLVSARWLELWRPELGITPILYSQKYVAPVFKAHNVTDRSCGVTSMCEKANPDEQATLAQFAPIVPHRSEDPFQVYSFEPSLHLYDMHQEFRNAEDSIMSSPLVKSLWKWYKIAASDFDGDLYFKSLWNEGSKLEVPNTKKTPNIRSATLDTLAYGADKMFGERTIDILKIDAETVDAKVISGASRLLQDKRIRVLMWETPNDFPIDFPDCMGGRVQSFGELVEALNKYGGMTCYFPGKSNKAVRLTGCSQAVQERQGASCRILHNNALCVHREIASSLYSAMEASSLIY